MGAAAAAVLGVVVVTGGGVFIVKMLEKASCLSTNNMLNSLFFSATC